MRRSYDISRFERFVKSWKGMGAAVAMAAAVVFMGTDVDRASGKSLGVSLPGPEYTLSIALPADRAVKAEIAEDDADHDEENSARVIERGQASYYGAGFAGRPTANGETFNPDAMTAAHPSLPFGTELRVTNKANGKQVVVRVNDRGPFAKNRIIDLSEAAAGQIGMIKSGTASVVLERI